MIINTFNAVAGGGKTHAIAIYAHRLARKGNKVLLVQPTIQLIDNTYTTEFLPLDPTYTIQTLHSATDIPCESVLKSIIKQMESGIGGGEVLMITHAAFMRIPHISDRKYWTVIMDEVPGVEDYTTLNLADNHRLLTNQLKIIAHGNDYSELEHNHAYKLSANEVSLRRLADNKYKDGVSAYVQDTAHRILSDDWHVYVRPEQYTNLIHNRCEQLGVHSLLTPDIFKGYQKVLIASALFYDSVLYKLWHHHGWAAFVDCHPSLYDNLRYDRHNNGQYLTIQYYMNYEWSKNLRDMAVLDDTTGKRHTLLDELGSIIKADMGNKPFAWMGNKDLTDDYLGTSNAVRLPNTPHGLNCYQNYHHAVIISALNPAPAHYKFMAIKGISEDELKTSYYRHAVYQAAMRISLRDPSDTTPKTITVMDASTAYWLQDLFTGAQIKSLTGCKLRPRNKTGRPKLYSSDADKSRAYRERKKQREDAMLQEVSTINDPGQSANKMPNLNQVPIFNSIYDAVPSEILTYKDNEDLIRNILGAHTGTVKNKNNNVLVSSAVFNPTLNNGETKRGIANISHINYICLDNDGGDLSHEEFASLFAELRMVIMNTFSSTEVKPRWRCYIPISEAIGIETHDMLINNIRQRLAIYGYYGEAICEQYPDRKQHGFDESKFTPNSLFYAPSQAGDAEYSFCKDYKEKGRNILNVQEWINGDTSPIHLDDEDDDTIVMKITVATPSTASPNSTPNNPNQAKIDAAITSWRNAPRGHGYTEFAKLFGRLKKCGMSYADLKDTLWNEASYAHSPKERRMEVKSLMKYY